MVLTKIIFEYLKSNRRITIPALGTFLLKGDGSPLLFSEFMKGDDPTLRGLLIEQAGMSELEAAICIDRFVFDLRHALERGGRYALPYLGYMCCESGESSYSFEADPTVEPKDAAPGDSLLGRVAKSSKDERVDDEIDTEVDQISELAEESGDEAEAEGAERERVEAVDTRAKRLDVEQLYGSSSDSLSDSSSDLVEEDGEPQTEGERAKVDWWIWGAIIALVFAILAVCYGVTVEWLMGKVSFGEGIDTSLESFFGSEFGSWVEDLLLPKPAVEQVMDVDLVPQDTIIIRR